MISDSTVKPAGGWGMTWRSTLPEPLRVLVRFLYMTGWRVGEALGLTWAGVDFTNGVVRLEPGVTKNREGREFPFAALPPLADLLCERHRLRRPRPRRVRSPGDELHQWAVVRTSEEPDRRSFEAFVDF